MSALSDMLHQHLDAEMQRQTDGIELIPSENYVSQRVLDALGSVYTNKYSEGYPGRRYYGGQDNTDKVESQAINRAKQLFGCDHANLQPHSGAPANIGVYQAWLEPGDTVMGMDLAHGGHLTHGHPVTGSGKLYNFVRYGVVDKETADIDYDSMLEVAKKAKPKLIVAGFSGYMKNLDYAKFRAIADEVDAVLMMDAAHIAGLIAAKVSDNPFDYGFDIVTSTTHKTLRGPRGGMILTKGKVGNPLKKCEKTKENLPTLIDREIFPGLQGGPHMNNMLAKLVALEEASTPEYKDYGQKVLDSAKALARAMIDAGFTLVGGGTENHLILADVMASHGVDGGVVENTLDSVGLNLNKNAIPFDDQPPFRPSGVRLGTPALVTRGASSQDMPRLAGWMSEAISAREDSVKLSQIKSQVKEFANSLGPVVWQ